MKKILTSMFIVFLLTVSFASAMDFSLDIAENEKITTPFNSAFFTAHVESDLQEGGLYLFIEGAPSSWISMGTSYIDMPLLDAKDIEMEFYPNDKTGVYEYTVYLQSFLDKSLKVSKDITLIVRSGEKVDDMGHSITMKDNAATVTMNLVSSQKEDITVDYILVNSGGINSAAYTKSYMIKGETQVTETLDLTGELEAGTYTLKVYVKGTTIAFDDIVKVEPVRMIVTTENDVSGSMYDEKIISVSNEGNVHEDGYTVVSTLPTGFVSFVQQPDKCENGECEWTLSLGPKESAEIKYRVEYWPLFAEGLLIAVILGAFIIFGWNRMNVPALSKKLKTGDDGSYTAVIEIKNAGRKITNVVVRDIVSPLFKVRHEFESVKPVLKHMEDGTELVWNLPVIEPGDHRIIHYKVTPLVKGNLKVPKAYMRYVTENGKKTKVRTKDIHLAA